MKAAELSARHVPADCYKCGRPHEERQLEKSAWPDGKPGVTWADPIDGHAYERSPQATMDRLSALLAAETARADALEGALREAETFIALRPSGHTGPLDDRIPWFQHGGIAHGEDRPDCMACQHIARARALLGGVE